MTLFSPESHEPLTGTAWDAPRVRSAIAGVVAGVEAAFEDGWPVHPADEHDSLTTKRLQSVYMGGAGVVDALYRLARAPGIVATLGPLLDEDLALGGGELTWRAGPLEKGAGLCHGTSGNGYAFLVLFERTGDELWLMRARAFAMHALEQLQPERYSLWTGCLGIALYLADCVDGGGTLPIP